LKTQNQTHTFWLKGANGPTAAAPIVIAAAGSNNNPVPLTKEDRRTLLHRYATPKIDAACETARITGELIEHFGRFKIGERQEEDDDIPLSQLASQTNEVGNPNLEKHQRQGRLQPSQTGAPTTIGRKKAERATTKQKKVAIKAAAKRANGR
jgi:hypothetical protein